MSETEKWYSENLENVNCQTNDFTFNFILALGEATAKVTVLEKELASAQKTIGKSKRAQEVQQLAKENDSLQLKLRSQEDDFRLQNQALLQELSKVGHTVGGSLCHWCRPVNVWFAYKFCETLRLIV